ncbi:MAG: SDR family NAD(P)-dependent oxidoreductase [Pseudomonadales bacterium]
MGRLQDQVFIVTGGAQGIGRAYAEGIIREGGKAVIADLNGDLAAQTASELGDSAFAVTGDISKEDDANAMAKAGKDQFGRVDGLINNAAIYQRPAMRRVPFEEYTVEEWDLLMAVNLRGTFLCTKAVIPYLKEQGRGKIINISSGVVSFGCPFMTHYVTSKAGVIGFTRAVARELGPHNINVNTIAPGLTVSQEETEEEEAARKNRQPLVVGPLNHREEKPEDLVGAAIFLLSGESDMITGQTYAVDGGQWML